MQYRKIEAMHIIFGKCDGKKCADCCHLTEYKYPSRTVRKCKVYGVTASEYSDWRLKYDACGLFNKETDRIGDMQAKCVMFNRKSLVKEALEQPIDGQIGFMEEVH